MYEKIAVLVTNLLSAFMTSASGFWGWILKVVFKVVKKKIIVVAERIDENIENKKEANQELEKFNEVANKPNVTHEEITKAEDDFFNRP